MELKFNTKFCMLNYWLNLNRNKKEKTTDPVQTKNMSPYGRGLNNF